MTIGTPEQGASVSGAARPDRKKPLTASEDADKGMVQGKYLLN
jgi:hypothetical protein